METRNHDHMKNRNVRKKVVSGLIYTNESAGRMKVNGMLSDSFFWPQRDDANPMYN